jgi:hypothetical protein
MSTTFWFRRLLWLILGSGLLLGRGAATPADLPDARAEAATRALSVEATAADRYWAGSPAGAMSLYQEALKQWHALDDIHGIIRCRTSMFGLLRETTDAAVRAEWLRQTREIWGTYQATAGPTGAQPSAEFWRSQILIQHSILLAALEAQPPDLAAGGEALREARRAAGRLPAGEQRVWQLALGNLEARLHLAGGDAAAAARLLEASVATYAELGRDRDAVREVALNRFLAARLLQDQHRWPEAVARLETALDGFRLLGQTEWMQACLGNLVDVSRHQGREETARQYQLRLDALRRALAPETKSTAP